MWTPAQCIPTFIGGGGGGTHVGGFPRGNGSGSSSDPEAGGFTYASSWARLTRSGRRWNPADRYMSTFAGGGAAAAKAGGYPRAWFCGHVISRGRRWKLDGYMSTSTGDGSGAAASKADGFHLARFCECVPEGAGRWDPASHHPTSSCGSHWWRKCSHTETKLPPVDTPCVEGGGRLSGWPEEGVEVWALAEGRASPSFECQEK